mmetsp:Transcript_96008/g.271755  ORF Transcript_96008/g.271755 Transcript_96008/m.271755 type:complete len:601 (-) Transcript_96008:180-1982(-)
MGSGIQRATGRYQITVPLPAQSPDDGIGAGYGSLGGTPSYGSKRGPAPGWGRTATEGTPPPPPPPASPSVTELKGRLRELGLETPTGMVEKSELRRLVEDAEMRHACTENLSTPPLPPSRGSLHPPSPLGTSSASPLSHQASAPSPTPSQRSVGELKRRLRELGLEIPTTIVEKSELIALVDEAERQMAPHASDYPSVSHITSRSVPDLKQRLRELNVEVPINAVEKRELVVLVEEAERRHELRGRDYRDVAFCDDSTSASSAEDRPLRRASSVHCTRGACGVTAIHLAEPALDTDVPTIVVPEEAAPPVSSVPSVPVMSSVRVGADASMEVKGAQFTWEKGKLLGRGALGFVFKATILQTGQAIAAKEIFIDSNSKSDKDYRASLENEIAIMRSLTHPRIVTYLGHDYIEDRLYIYLDYMPGGSLSQVLKENGPLDESLIAEYVRQLLDGLHYLHTRDPQILHRDIKGGNILVGSDCCVKLADFGCSKRAMETMMTHTMMRGSIPWMAPEVIVHSRYGRAADVWSFGCLVIEAATARVPWGRFENQVAALLKIGMTKELPPLPEGVSEACHNFIELCVQRDATLRPCAGELLKHRFVQE